VKRIDAFPQNQIRFSFPATVIVLLPASARKAARVACALPDMPRKAMSCPADLGITYRLTFYRQASSYPRVVVDATGCEGVTGLVQVRWVARTPSFWRGLGDVMGLKNPTWTTFRGSGGTAG
jgi:hypothetical protein